MDENLKEVQQLKDLVDSKSIPEGLKESLSILLERVTRSAKYGNYSYEFESAAKYIYWVTSMPWGQYSQDDLDLSHAQQILDEDHYGMNVVKERLLEYLAVMQLRKERNTTSPIICFVGLQGIGKTSMAKSIARTLGRPFERISLGGMPSALELFGRSKATPDSEPGLIVKALIKAKVMSPIILLDEVEKSGHDLASRASVMASLLEILDPEQNQTFMDHYIGYPIDLSRVFFILTANNLGPISNALLDRLEIIKLTGYSDEEKEVIAKDYILPKVYENTGLSSNQLIFAEDVWEAIIRPLGYEAGIRELERVLMGVGRKAAKRILQHTQDKVLITKDNVKEFITLL